jgi:hypothetical protein
MKPIKVEVTGVTQISQSGLKTIRGGGEKGYIVEDDKFVGTEESGGKYEVIELRIERDEAPFLRIGNVSGQIAYVHFEIRIQDPELLGQFKTGDVLLLTKEQESEAAQ